MSACKLKLSKTLFSRLLQGKSERGANIGRAAHIDGLFVRLDDVLDDGEAESRAALFAGAAFVNPVKSVEKVLKVFFGDADAAIGHFHEDVFVHIVKTHLGRPIFVAIFDGVGDQIHEHLANVLPVCNHLVMLVGPSFEQQFDISLAGLEFEVFKHLLCQNVNVELLAVEDELA